MKQFGLLGYPITHSFSKRYFTEKFAKEGIAATYEIYPITAIEQFPQLIAEHPDLAGMNVTIPYKEAVMPYLNALDKEAEAIGAVNVIKFTRTAKGQPYLTGYNSDLIGFRESIRPLIDQLKKRLQKKNNKKEVGLKALILGTGGASKSVCYGLRQLGLETLFVSRSAGSECITYAHLEPQYYIDYQIIVNTTPLGMYPNTDTFPSLDYDQIGPVHLLYDVVYNPGVTKFLQYGEQRGALIKNGLEMLYLQAEASWDIWNV